MVGLEEASWLGVLAANIGGGCRACSSGQRAARHFGQRLVRRTDGHKQRTLQTPVGSPNLHCKPAEHKSSEALLQFPSLTVSFAPSV